MPKVLALLVFVACGAQLPERAAPPQADADAGRWPISGACQCCWPAWIHGPNRCRYVRADTVPPDPCESDPEQRCITPDAGVLPGL